MSNRNEPGVLEQAERLFDMTDDDRARSVLTSLKDAYELATEKAAKARSKVIEAEHEQKRAKEILENFLGLEFAHTDAEPSDAPESPEPCPAGVDPETGVIAEEEPPREAVEAKSEEVDDDPVPFEPEEGEEEEPEGYEEGAPGDIDAIEDEMFAEASTPEPKAPGDIPRETIKKMVDKVLTEPMAQHAHEKHDGVHYTLRKTVDAEAEGDLRLTIGDAPDDDFVIPAGVRFLEPHPRGGIGVDRKSATLRVSKATYLKHLAAAKGSATV